MYFVCPFCSFISDTGRTVEKCYKDCKNPKSEENNAKASDKNNKNRNYLIKKITTSQQNKLDKELVFGWYNQQRFLVVHNDYQYTCLCGSSYKSLTRLCPHFKNCPWLESFTNIKGTTSKAKQFGCDQPIIIKYNYPDDNETEIATKKNKMIHIKPLTYYIPYGINTISQDATTTVRNGEEDIIRICRFIDSTINMNFGAIEKLLETVTDSNDWGARHIQCGRIEINVCKETIKSKNIGTGCWDRICDNYHIPTNYMTHIVTYAKKMSMRTVGINSDWRMGSFKLILTNSAEKQQEHLDLTAPLAQFALMISHDVDTTISYNVTASSQVESMSHLGDLLADVSVTWNGLGDRNAVGTLVTAIKNLDNDENCDIASSIRHAGYGKLFQILKRNNHGCDHPKYFGHESVVMKHAPTCTYTKINGGIIHSGSGIISSGSVTNWNRIRTILFWSGNPTPESHEYDPDLQENKLTVIMEVISYLWNRGKTTRPQMVGFIYHIFKSCEINYQHFPQKFRGTALSIMLDKFSEVKKNPTARYLQDMFEEISANDNLFPNPAE